jgi:hypothetical protein
VEEEEEKEESSDLEKEMEDVGSDPEKDPPT